MADFYNLEYNTNYITLENKEWIVPEEYDNIVPLYAGKKINWKVTV